MCAQFHHLQNARLKKPLKQTDVRINDNIYKISDSVPGTE